MLLYGAKAWTLSSIDAASLGLFERKVLLNIFGKVRVGDDYSIRTNRELYELFNDMDVLISCDSAEPLLREEYLMRPPAVIDGWDDRVRVGKMRLKRL